MLGFCAQSKFTRQLSNIFTISIIGVFLTTPTNANTSCRHILDKPDGPAWSKSAKPKDRDVFRDTYDFHRDWGTRLLLDTDPIWSDPEYLRQLHEFAVPRITNYDKFGPPSKLKADYENLLRSFAEGSVLNYTVTGTAANNLFYEYAEVAYQLRTGKRAKRVQLLAFNHAYGGSHGRTVEVKYGGNKPDGYGLPTPFIHPNKPLNKAELEDIIATEKAALDKIRHFVSDPTKEVGGIFIEPASINHGLRVYRPEFMTQLRALADELEVPIFADEIMSGGRTGKFWAYQHYEGFVPDAVSFGKGLIVAGVFQPSRLSNQSYFFYHHRQGPETTTAVQPLVLLQARQVLKAIKERDLLKNAEEMGRYYYEAMQKKAELSNIQKKGDTAATDGTKYVKWLGLMLQEPDGRLLPPITITKEQIDYRLSESYPKDRY